MLRAWIDGAGLTLRQAALVIGVPERTLSRVLTEAERLRWDTADRVAIALGTHPSAIWPEWFRSEDHPRTGELAS
jgi:lambda repressor-like predicted transcriptional regulator